MCSQIHDSAGWGSLESGIVKGPTKSQFMSVGNFFLATDVEKDPGFGGAPAEPHTSRITV